MDSIRPQPLSLQLALASLVSILVRRWGDLAAPAVEPQQYRFERPDGAL
jgi:hypothetical protein